MALKKTDFQTNKKDATEHYERGAKINGRDVNLRIEVKKNFNKGLFTVKPIANSSLFVDEPTKDKATVKLMSDLMYEAVKDALSWKADWHEANADSDNDNDQMSIDDGLDQ
jgi:hypothetical protein